MAKLVMNPALRPSGVEFCKGALGTKLSSNGYTSSAPANLPSTPKISFPTVSCSESRGRRQRRAAIAVGKEAKEGQVDEVVQNGSNNGAANRAATGTSKIRDAILEKPKTSSAYDYSHLPGPRSIHNYMEQVWTAASSIPSFHKN